MTIVNIKKIHYYISPHGSLIKDLLELKSNKLKNIYLNLFGKKILENAKLVHCLTEYEKTEIEKFNFNIRETSVLPNALDEDDFSELPEKNKLFKLHPNIKGKRIILFLSRITLKKGLDDLIPAMKEVVRCEPNSHLLVVGNDEENYINEVKKWIKEYNLEKFVTYVGPAYGQDKYMYYQDSDLFVLPSYSENFALVVIEAMYFRLPVIVTKNVGASEYVKASNSGIIINKNREEIAEAILRILKHDNMSLEMGENGSNYVKENLTWDKVINKYIEVYKSSLSLNH